MTIMRPLVAALAIAVAWATAAPAAHAAPDAPAGADSIALRWDGPTTALDWRGGTYAYAEDNFIGSPLSVPGDVACRTAIVRNDGPTDATATVTITATTTNADETVNTELDTLVHLFWDVNGHAGDETWRRVTQDSYRVSFPVARGKEFPITVGYEFPWESTGGRNHDAPSSVLSFGVRVMLEGATAKGPLPRTGGEVVDFPFILVAALLIGSSALALLAHLRRKNQDKVLKEP